MTTETNSGALKIEWDELYSAETESQVQDIITARSVPLVREVGAAAEAKPAWYRGQIVQMSLAGLLGGLLAWGLTEVILSAYPEMSATASNILFTMVLGFGIGLVVALWEGISDQILGQDQDRADPHRPGAGRSDPARRDHRRPDLPAVDRERLRRLSRPGVHARLDGRPVLRRAVVGNAPAPRRRVGDRRTRRWALRSGSAAATGRRSSTGPSAVSSAGSLGGFMFDFFTSGPAARAFGIMITGLAIGLGIALVERARRQHWLEIVSGGMAGKQFILYGDRTTIGTAPDNDVTLIKDPAIAPHHAVLNASSDSLELAAQSPAYPTLVNGAPVEKRTLVDGDVVQFGTTMLRYRNKSEQPVVAGAIVG